MQCTEVQPFCICNVQCATSCSLVKRGKCRLRCSPRHSTGTHFVPCPHNDLPAAVQFQVRLFADDCLRYLKVETQVDNTILQNDLTNLEKWAEGSGMRSTQRNATSSASDKSPHITTNSIIISFNRLLQTPILVSRSMRPCHGLTISTASQKEQTPA